MAPPKPIPGHAQRKRRSSGVVVPHAPRWHQRAAAWLVFALVRLISMTLRFQWKDSSEFFATAPGAQVIFCIWHNRLALCMPAYDGFVRPRKPGARLAALVSASKDGGLLAAILECFGVQPVRGSSSRRGPQALLELTTWAERGYDLAITPDGPRGPRYIVQEGVMSLAQITGLPIIPFSFRTRWKLCAKSWDRFQIPLPFSRCDMVIGPALRVPREVSAEQREALRQKLEQTLRQISE